MMLSKLLVRGTHCIAQFTSDLAGFLAFFQVETLCGKGTF